MVSSCTERDDGRVRIRAIAARPSRSSCILAALQGSRSLRSRMRNSTQACRKKYECELKQY